MSITHHRPLAIVTGAAKRLGKAVALGLAREGYAIGLHFHHSIDLVAEMEQELIQLNVPAVRLQADLTDEAQVDRMFDMLLNEPYDLRVLVNSAAVMSRGNLESLSTAEWDYTLNLNLRAPWLCAIRAAKMMKLYKGVIINLTDAGDQKTWTGYPAYTVSKAGLETLTRLMARALAPQVRVNAVAPGLILPSTDLSEKDWQRLIDKLPLKRGGNLDEIVEAILFLVRNEYVTGQTLVVDGGYQLI